MFLMKLVRMAALVAVAAALHAQDPSSVEAVVTTDAGTFRMEFAPEKAPKHVAQFLKFAKEGYYDGSAFFRVVLNGIIQGGDPEGTGMGGPGYSIKDEPVVGNYHRGTLAMARTNAPDSQGSQFFIVLDDAAAGPLESVRTYAILGEVVSGLDVVDEIAAVERDGGDRPIDPVSIVTATSGPSAP